MKKYYSIIKRAALRILLLLLISFPGVLTAQEKSFNNFRRGAVGDGCETCTDPAYRVTDLLPEGSFTKGMEGPAVDKKGNLYAVNFREQGTIGVVTPEGVVSEFVVLPQGSVGNGIRFGRDGKMYIADYTKHNILRVNLDNRQIEVYAHNSTMNQPNDLTISPVSGIIYASDPAWRDSTGMLWMITLDRKVTLLEKNMGTTNGIEVSPDGKLLYVNESIQRNVWVYDILPDGSISGKRLFYKFDDFGMDGMRCDPAGNLYITRHGKGTVVKLSPNGNITAEYLLKGKLPTNITFSNDYKKAYVTLADRGCFEVIEF
jgi:sugar lactone lactonase YvrE